MSFDISAARARITRLNNIKSRLSSDTGHISAVNTKLDTFDDLLREAVKGGSYGLSQGDMTSMHEKAPSEDGYIASAKSSIDSEINAIEEDIAEEEARREAERKAAAEAAARALAAAYGY